MKTLPRYRRVLVTTDFSRVGDAAIPHAFALLGAAGGTVALGHVLERPELPNPFYAHYTPGHALTPAERAALRRSLQDELRERVRPYAALGRFRVSCRVVETRRSVEEAIVKLAAVERADAIVLGSHGHSPVGRLLLGSIVDAVMRRAKVPVLVVRGS